MDDIFCKETTKKGERCKNVKSKKITENHGLCTKHYNIRSKDGTLDDFCKNGPTPQKESFTAPTKTYPYFSDNIYVLFGIEKKEHITLNNFIDSFNISSTDKQKNLSKAMIFIKKYYSSQEKFTAPTPEYPYFSDNIYVIFGLNKSAKYSDFKNAYSKNAHEDSTEAFLFIKKYYSSQDEEFTAPTKTYPYFSDNIYVIFGLTKGAIYMDFLSAYYNSGLDRKNKLLNNAYKFVNNYYCNHKEPLEEFTAPTPTYPYFSDNIYVIFGLSKGATYMDFKNAFSKSRHKYISKAFLFIVKYYGSQPPPIRNKCIYIPPTTLNPYFSDNVYTIFEIEKGSTFQQFKRSYHGLSLKYHPDKNKTPEAIPKIREINNAYEVVKNHYEK